KEYESIDNRIVYIQNEKNIGLARSLNIGISKASNDIIIRMDADDISSTDRISKQLQEYEKTNYDFIFTAYKMIDGSDKITSNIIGYYSEEYIKKNLAHHNMLHHPTVLFSKKTIEEIGGYNPYPIAQDYDVWLRANLLGK